MLGAAERNRAERGAQGLGTTDVDVREQGPDCQAGRWNPRPTRSEQGDATTSSCELHKSHVWSVEAGVHAEINHP